MNRDRRLRVVLALLVLTSLTLITLDFRSGSGASSSPVRSARSVTAAVFGPVQRAVGGAASAVGSALGSLPRLGRYRSDADRLRRENSDLRTQLRTSELARQRSAELDRLLRVAGAGQYRVVPARVVALGQGLGFEWTATLDAGSRDGVTADLTVINGDGLVGRVKSVGPYTSVVLLAIDGTFSAGSRLEGSLDVGLVTGKGQQPMGFQLLNPQAKVSAGDRLVTLGSPDNKPFVPGVPIGSVTSVETTPGALVRSALVAPYVSFAALDLVGIVVEPPRQNPRDGVLPPKPDPTPTPGAPATPGAPGAPAPAPGPALPPAPTPSTSPTRR
ncbi:MAG: rod shape-determining protein MreC [Actinomycetota bacterium]|nr:rod shape-determining protein MreC [Actinomycetota bacterium]